MTNINRSVIETRLYNDLYRIELFNTGYVIVFRKTDDSSTNKTKIIGRQDSAEDQGYTALLNITNFSEHYSTPVLEHIVELLENFIEKSGIIVSATTEPVIFNYQDPYSHFIQDVLNNDTYSDVKKWCVLASILQETSSLISEENLEFLNSVFERQIDPETVENWITLQQSTHYIYPTFPDNGRTASTTDERNSYSRTPTLETRLFTKNQEQFKKYITIVNLLKNSDCTTLDKAKEAGFVNYPSTLNEEEIDLIVFYLFQAGLFKAFSHLGKEEVVKIKEGLHLTPILKSDLNSFIVNQILTEDLRKVRSLENKGLFLPYEEYDEFLRIVGPLTDQPSFSSPYFALKRAVEISVYSGKYLWDFWMSMSKIFFENDRDRFTQFFTEWIELIEEQREYEHKLRATMNKLIKPDVIFRYFAQSQEEGIPARYLWYLQECNS